MRITEQLSRDHQTILRSLNILKFAAASWQKYEPGAAEDCRALLEFLQIFADRCHHGKEERVLFPSLAKAGIPVDGGPIGVMLHEHDEGRMLVRGMQQALDGVKPSDFALYAARYIELLEAHIMKEDNILFPRAEDFLTFEDDEALLHRFEEVEQEMGTETHEKFDQLLYTLASKYISKPARAS